MGKQCSSDLIRAMQLGRNDMQAKADLDSLRPDIRRAAQFPEIREESSEFSGHLCQSIAIYTSDDGPKWQTGQEQSMPAKKRKTISEQLRDAIVNDDRTHYMLAKAAGIDATQLDRFVSGERPNLRIDTLDKLCPVLSLELRPVKD
jgi:DNA-binding Xre family transcriptional regulator